MKLTRILVLFGAMLLIQPVWAVYAPIPEQEQGKEFSVLLQAGISHDSNIFGSATGEIDSLVYSFSPKLSLNSSLTDQTFLTASYRLTLDHFSDRPGDKTLDSHALSARLAHAFSEASTIDISDTYSITRNPESTLAGVPVNTDQSFKRNQFDGRYTTKFGQKMDGIAKFRTIDYAYDNANLATEIDRTENLYGVEVGHQLLPEMRLLGEYRHQTINYDSGGSTKDKTSDFVIGGVDYEVAKKTSLTGKLGYEWRARASESNSESPYVEVSAKRDYAAQSYVASGYVYTFEETSNTTLYNDTKVSRLFVNVQHAVTALILVSGSFNYEPSVLQGRRGVADVDETTTRFGLAGTYLLNRNWTFSVTYDHDNVDSDDPARSMERDRIGFNAALSF